MIITPLDIRKQPFRKTSFGGFDKDAVNSFLEMVANEYETVIRQNDDLAMKLKSVEEKLGTYMKIEKNLSDTLLTAQRATDEARLNAQKEAELIIKDAQIRADRYIDKSREKVNSLEAELLSLRTQRDSFLTRFRSLLKDQLSLVEVIAGTISDNPAKNYYESSLYAEEDTMDEVPPQPVV